MGEFEEETYSTVFTALKHPIRRKILRVLSIGQHSFTDLQNSFNVNSPVLTYHLDAMKDLVSKTEDGKYRLSAMGEGAMALMERVEEPPKAESSATLNKSRRKVSLIQMFTVFGAIALVTAGLYLAAFTTVQTSYSLPYNSISAPTSAIIDGVLYKTNINLTLPPTQEMQDSGGSYVYVGFESPKEFTPGAYNIRLNYLQYSESERAYIVKTMDYSGKFTTSENRGGYAFMESLQVPFGGGFGGSINAPLNIVVGLWTNTTLDNAASQVRVEAPLSQSQGGYRYDQPYLDKALWCIGSGIVALVAILLLSILQIPRKIEYR